ncbi:MAG: hypothetical protein ITG02_01470 [Patulibacter sp.]|nr:hypothetical protein [Patulibacter sp.]
MQHFADEYFVCAQDHVLHHRQNAVGKRFAQAEADLERHVASLADDQVLGLDDPAWAQQVMAEIEVPPPALDVGAAEGICEGAITVDCAGAPGISYSTTERGGSVLRDGNRLRLVVPGVNIALLASSLPSGGTGRRVDIHDDRLERTYEWPQVRSAEELEADIEAVLRELEHGCEQIATQVRERNEKLASRVLTLVEERRQKILAAQSFVGGLRLPIRPRTEASGLPPFRWTGFG